MKRLPLVCLLGMSSLLLSSNFISAQVVVTTSVIREITTTFTSLFGALRNGDVQTIKLYLSDQEYGRRKVLFEQNYEYPAFLRNFYRGAAVRVGRSTAFSTQAMMSLRNLSSSSQAGKLSTPECGLPATSRADG
jgi:hypothetical protein